MAQEEFNATRVINIVLGIWLFISAFLWMHTYAQMTNTWIVGLVCMAIAIIALKVPEARYVNTALAVWLLISVWALPTRSVGTQWNNALVALAIFFVSLAPAYLAGPGARPPSRS